MSLENVMFSVSEQPSGSDPGDRPIKLAHDS